MAKKKGKDKEKKKLKQQVDESTTKVKKKKSKKEDVPVKVSKAEKPEKTKKSTKKASAEKATKVKAKAEKPVAKKKASKTVEAKPVAKKVALKKPVVKKAADKAAPLPAPAPTEFELERDLLTLVTHVQRLASGQLQLALKAEAISTSQWEILSTLAADEAITQQTLAKALFVSEGNITQMLAKMEKLGWIQRRRDWRTNYVTLTASGHALQEKVRALYDASITTFFAELNSDEQATLSALLAQLLSDLPTED